MRAFAPSTSQQSLMISQLRNAPCAFRSGTSRRQVQVLSFNGSRFRDPYAILGVEAGSSEGEVKRAYRKLAKQHHPDVAKESSETAHLHFVNITEAYEFILQLMRAKKEGIEGQKPGNTEAWHEWYWSFRMSRNYERQKQRAAGEEAPGPQATHAPKPQDTEGLRSQLAGLRHRAAIRRNRPAPATAPADDTSDHVTDPEQFYVAAEGPSDSADVPITHAYTAPEPQHEQPASHAGLEAAAQHDASEVHAAMGAADPNAHVHRRKFVASSDSREALKSQLHGMRRKAQIRQRFQQTVSA